MLRRLDLRGTGTDDLRRRLPRPAAQTEPPIDEVRALLAEVREHGDDALRAFAVRFDGVELDDLRVPPADVAAALDEIPRDLRDALEAAHENIAAYHDAQRSDEVVHHNGALEIRELVRPVDRVGCYVPSALAPLVSTALMTLVPAKVAGVPEVVLVAQDLAAYGRDQGVGERSIIPLVQAVSERVARTRLGQRERFGSSGAQTMLNSDMGPTEVRTFAQDTMEDDARNILRVAVERQGHLGLAPVDAGQAVEEVQVVHRHPGFVRR